MKKLSFSMVFLICFVILFSACKQNKGIAEGLSPKLPVSITIWHYYNGLQKTVFDSLVSEFNETVGKEYGIAVESMSRGSINDLHKSILESANKKVGSDEMPDIFAAYTDMAIEIDALGLIAELDKYFTSEEIDEYIESYIDEGRFDENNTLKVFPVAKSTEIMMLNDTDWKKFAENTGALYDDLATWEGLSITAEKYYNYTDSLTEKPNDGKSFFGRDAFANYMIVGSMQLGEEIYKTDENGVELNINKDVMRKLWDNFYVPYIKGYYGSYGRFASDDAKTGDVIAIVCSSSGASYFPENVTLSDDITYEIDFKVLTVPNFKDKPYYSVQQGAGFAITKSDDKKERASVIFLKWFTESERNMRFAGESGYLPVKKESSDYDFLRTIKENGDIELSPEVQDVLKVILKDNREQSLYTCKALNNGYEARNILNSSMFEKAKTDRNMIDSMIQNGMPREEAIAYYNTDDNFNIWFEDFSSKMNKTVN